ncbi:MAG: hypothetical protein ACP5N7_02380, partial [Candidatus Pacearchaeota archaeon]
LQHKFNISTEQIIEAWIYWDTGIKKYSNQVYSSHALRVVMHLHNYLAGSWHEKRQKIVLEYLDKINSFSICEIGFGVPQKYVQELLSKDNTKLLLTDFEQTSLDVATSILDRWNSDWKSKVDLQIFDLNKHSLPAGYDTYVFQDSIEHADDPTAVLNKYVQSTPEGTYFIFSLPIEIENPIPEHHILWENEDNVLEWLKSAGLTIIDYQPVSMNKNVDIYSLFLHPEFRELLIFARK